MTAMIGRLWQMSLQASALILIILAVRPLIRRYPKIYSYGLWLLVGIGLLCPVMPRSPFSLQPDISDVVFAQNGGNPAKAFGLVLGDNQRPEGAEEQERGTGGFSGTVLGNGEEANSAVPGNSRMDYDRGNGRGEGGMDRVLQVLRAVYLAGTAALCAYYLAQYLRLRRRIAAAVRESGNIWLCEAVSSPFVVGFWSPRILLPYTLGEPEKSHILRHEKTHIRHRDPLARLAGAACLCLHWWNPLVWLAVRCMEQDMEMFCDESTLKNADFEEQRAYLRTLLSCAERQSGLTAGLAFGESNTERRVENIMKKRKNSRIVLCCVAALAVFCAAAFLTIPGRAEAENAQGLKEAPVYFGELAAADGAVYAAYFNDEPDVSRLPVETNFFAVYHGELYYAAERVGSETGEAEEGRLTVYCCGLSGEGKRRVLELPQVYAVGRMAIQDGYLYCDYVKSMEDAAPSVVRVRISGEDQAEHRLPAETGYPAFLGFGGDSIYYCVRTDDGESIFYCCNTASGETAELYRCLGGYLQASAVRGDQLLLCLEDSRECRLLALSAGNPAEAVSFAPDSCSLLSGQETYCTIGTVLYRLDEKEGKFLRMELALPEKLEVSEIRLSGEEGKILYLTAFGKITGEPDNMRNTFLIRYDTANSRSELLLAYYTP